MRRKNGRSRCIWCNGAEGDLVEVGVAVPDRLGLGSQEESIPVHPAHEPDARAFLARLSRYGKRFVIGIAAIWVLMPLGTAAVLLLDRVGGYPASVAAGVIFGPVLLGLAAWIWVYPFPTSETVRWLGIRKSVVAVRMGAVLIAATAAWMAWP